MERRTDQLTALYIDAVIDFCEPDYRQCAIVTLLDYGLAVDTVLRILAEPRVRRPYGGSREQASPRSESPRSEPDLQPVLWS
jgi:hypothetical protein